MHTSLVDSPCQEQLVGQYLVTEFLLSNCQTYGLHVLSCSLLHHGGWGIYMYLS